ncbi:hypothetical protein [Crocosphaera sp. Alani8]|uniref:hypothetical protein n=1 Tax=Crocosphaera sp. Alani8 TaxID=3038952 RepID=UPI00313C3250
MKYKNLGKYVLLACLVSISCIFISTKTQLKAQTIVLEKTIPKEILPCLPMDRKEPDREPIIEGAIRYQGNDYYVIRMLYETNSPFENDPEPYYRGGRFAVTVDEIGCLNLNTIDQSTELIFSSLLNVLPKVVAQQMALEKWQSELERLGGKEQLKAYILEGIQPGPWQTYLFQEDLYALRRLGLDLPDSVLTEKPELAF